MAKPESADEKLQRESRERLEIIFKDDPLARPSGTAPWTGVDMVHTASVIFASFFMVFVLYRFARILLGLRGVKAKRAEAVKRRREFKVAAPAVDLFDLPALPQRTETPDLEDIDTNSEAKPQPELQQPKLEASPRGFEDRETNIAFKESSSDEINFDAETRAQKPAKD